MVYAVQAKAGEELNRIYAEDLSIHEWYRFVLSYPPHLVRRYIDTFGLTRRHWVLDPFCGTGTTLVECKKNGIPSTGLEANPVVQFAAQTKVRWDIDPDNLVRHAKSVAEEVEVQLKREEVEDYPLFKPCTNGKKIGLKRLEPELEALLIKNSISPKPLHKALALINNLNKKPDDPLIAHERLALAKQLVYSISNLRFGPEVGVGKPKEDAPVIAPWLKGVKDMANDLCCTQVKIHKAVPSLVKLTDSRSIDSCLEPLTFDAVITSPPYPNEKDYTRTTRLEAVLLGYLNNRDDLRRQKQNLLRSNSRGVYKADVDECWVKDNERIQELADRIETRRLELKKTSGFEKLYARVVRLYFGGMARHLEELKQVLAPGAQLAYVVGDQASFFRILIRTGELLANIAEDLGYEVTGIDLFRTRFSTATREHLREEVVLLRWNS